MTRGSFEKKSGWKRHRVRILAALCVVGAGVAILLSAGALDRHLRHGAHLTWEAEIDGTYQIVTRTVEHRPHFRSDHRPLGRFVQDWNFERDGVPGDLFAFRATWRSEVHVPRAGLTLRTRNTGSSALFVDGKYYDGEELMPGTRRITAIWRDDFREHAEFPQTLGEYFFVELCRDSQCAELRAEQTQLRRPWRTSRTLLWGAALSTIVLLLILAFFIRDHVTLRRRLSQGALAALLVFGVGLRLHDYDISPDFRENGDELFASWNGWQLLEDGRTRGWSLWAPLYSSRVQHETHKRFGMTWMMIQPYFEHPPLTHLLAGAAAHLGGASDWKHVRTKHTRLVPIVLFVPTLLLLFALTRRLWPLGYAAHFACFLYASLPMIVMQQRAVKEEALLVPLALGAVYCALRAREGPKWVHGAAILAGLCALAKVTGFAFVPAIAFMLWAQYGWRTGVRALLVGAAVGSLLLVYGALIDWNGFLFSTLQQGRRPAHYVQFLRFLDVAQINSAEIGRGWVLFLWIACFASLSRLKAKQHISLSAPLIFYWSAIGLGAGSWFYGWYTLPLYPFLCAGAGCFLWELYRSPDLLKGALVTYALVFYSLFFLESPDFIKYMGASGAMRHTITLCAGAFMGAYALAQLWPKRLQWMGRGALIASLLVVAYVGVLFATDYDIIYRAFKTIDTDSYFLTG